jgi:N-acetylglutamate synthase-like GNAT family acetyltransferase
VGGFLVARDNSGRLVGSAGLERHGNIGLLRSVAVAPDLQKSGLGSRLVSAVISEGKKSGVKEIVLLTTTARDFFAGRFGFSETGRENYDETLRDSPEWTLPRCSSAVVMRARSEQINFRV